jgi:hypothetical protein
MRKRTAIGVSVSVVVGIAALVGCSSSKDTNSATPVTPTPEAGTTADGGDTDGGTDSGTNVELPKPVLCPETNFVSPKLPNSVYVGDVTLAADTTWTADKIYLINDDFRIVHKLTVEAGTTICLSNKGRMLVGEGIDPGEIHLNGTKDKPVVITAFPSTSDPTKPDAYHGGIKFDTYQASTLSYVNIWYGGAGGGSSAWAFELTDTAHGTPDVKAPLLVDHLVVGAVQAKGVRVGTDLGIADGSSIQFTGFTEPFSTSPVVDAVAEVEITSTKSFAKAFNFTGAPIPDAAKHVKLRIASTEGKIQQNTDLVDIGGLPFLLKNQLITQVVGMQNDPVGATLTIHEGVTLKMDGVFIVGATSGTAQGNLVVAGTTAKPVVFTSTSDTPASGDWEGFYFVGGQYNPAKTKIDNAQILYAGVDPTNGQQINHHVGRCGANFEGAVMITGSSVSTGYDGPAITNTKIAHSKSEGIVSDATTMGAFCQTSYNKPDVTFDDIAGTKINVATCP